MIARVLQLARQQRTRAWLYRVASAVIVLAAGYGLLTGSESALWLGLAAAVLGTGTAAANTPRRPAPPGAARLRDQDEVRRRLGWKG